MAVGSNGTHNKPVFNNVSTTQSDLQAVADFAEVVGNSKTGTTAQMNALAGNDVWEGLLFGNTDTGLTYQREGGAWLPVQGAMFDVSNGLFPVATQPATTTPIRFQAGTSAVNLNSNGDGTITFPTAFPTGLLTFQLQRYDYSNYGGSFQILNATQSKSAATFRAFNSAGNPLASVTVYYTWLAIGW